MTIEELGTFFGWCAVINYGVLMFWFLVLLSARDWVFRFHSRWFALSKERFDAIHYAMMGIFKLGIFLFNLAPYIALQIVG